MDELTLDDKKYISTKQAARLTGYAKDYVGQMCREGRIPARMVGRSWYVLASAIQDHRFGMPEETTVEEAPAPHQPFSTWAAPRYEAAKTDPLPSLNRLEAVRDSELKADISPATPIDPQELSRSWSSWFDTAQRSIADEPIHSDTPIESPEGAEEANDEPPEDDTEVSIPIHTVYEPEPLPAAVAPRVTSAPASVTLDTPNAVTHTGRGKRSSYAALKVSLVALAFISIAVAAVGTGYSDKYISSFKQAELVAGISYYNK